MKNRMKSRVKSRRKLHSRKKKGGNTLETLKREERELKDNLNKSQKNIRVLDTAIFNYQMAIRNLDEQIQNRTGLSQPIRADAKKRQEKRKADRKKFNETLEKIIESKRSEATKLFDIESRLREKQNEIDKHPDTIEKKRQEAEAEKLYREKEREQERFLREFHEQRQREQERERGQSEITSRLLDEETSTREPKLPPPRPPPIEREVSIDRPKYGDIQILDGGKSRKHKHKSRKHKSRKHKSRKHKSRK